MSEQQALVLVAGYQDLDVARGDFEALAGRVGSNELDVRGAVLVGKDAAGHATVVDTGNHLGRKGAGLAGDVLQRGLMSRPAARKLSGGLAAEPRKGPKGEESRWWQT